MIDLKQFNNGFLLLPKIDNKKLQDFLKYKQDIVKLRIASKEKKICKITYFKEKSNEIKQYQIYMTSYYVRFDTRKKIIYAIDINDKKKIKTFFLENIQKVQITEQQIDSQIQIILN